MIELKIDPEFENLIPKLTDAEYAQLEKNILTDGKVKEPIVVWNGTIIDGHHRYYIVKKHPEIPFEVEEKDFKNKYAAMAWACANQLGRRNLSDKDRMYLIGKRYEEEKLSIGGTGANQHTKEQFPKPRETANISRGTSERIGKEYGVGHTHVEDSEKFANGVDIVDEIIPGLKEEILHGDLDVPKSVIKQLPKATPDKQRKAAKAISENNISLAKAILEKPIKKEPEPEPEPYNIDDLLEEVKAAQSELHFALNQILIVTHPDVVSGKKEKDKAIESLQDIMDDVQEFIEELLDMED